MEPYSFHLILGGIVIVLTLTVGAFFILWTSPNGQGSINNAVLEGENAWAVPNEAGCSSCISGPAAVSVGPDSTAQYIIEFQTNYVSQSTQGQLYSSPDQDLYVVTFQWTPPSSDFFSFERQYVVFTYSFQFGISGTTRSTVWFTGPQGNLSQSVHTSKYGGTDVFHGGLYGTSIIEVDSAGNYTLHYSNPLSGSLNGTIAMGPSSVTFTRPYLNLGLGSIGIAAAFATSTVFVSWKKLRNARLGSMESSSR